ncbi:MAG TPA: hypothetical protein DEE98_03380 [Elusimicrobia bacterium]|nr:MAG: hypothetical protein A2278_08195 [Elusimicrobia bacterium RIFOXYA12_FULL_49_49]OGS11059.1 MAG: hypothetical protein A2386_04330 [Elusimicrobia bacterium RIFOXYB1_FULL_48_9]OGS15955.1 MAG: hypothetical protein A2251_02070 [Elusimicrobia bacterium RIFOXYA2_FULL_47_53]OGS29123.1 MAG: hypothetical protein A2323_04610 [Elusimicrobia bacterium RIFOXYB2_FULL_46_23]HBU69407.1 hypothetical protein [Elusimicrobiota bacterium]
MNIYLINPPAADGVKIVREGRCMQRKGAWTSVWSPISLAILGAIARQSGHTVKLSDCIVEEIDFNELKNLASQFKPDLAIINAVTPSIESDLSTCRYLKEANPAVLTAAIGIHPTTLPEDCLNAEPALDFVIRGEPEATVKEMLAALAQGNDLTLSAITGLAFRKNGRLFREPDRKPIEDLNELPFPAWDLIDTELYTLPFSNKKFLLIATSRGCPYPCRFCADAAYYGKKLRVRSPKNVVDELEWAKNTYKIDEFLFWSESFTINKQFSIDVAREILSRGLKISWVCNSRVDNVDIEMLRLFKKAGCWMIGFGIESGNQNILNSMKKGITVEQIESAVKASHEAGLEVTGHCVIGYPGETVETIKDTINLTKRLPFDFVQFYCSVPFPGSELYAQAREMGWINTNNWMFFEQNFCVMDTPQLKAKDAMKWRSRAYRQFYLRPSVIIKTIRRLSNWKEFINFLRMAKDFLTWVK